ncbi:uncharacterized protein LOC119385345 [Rhipicephalus sanguineus]|uniref:uncharacterized protein LOC119385345 n=1 Tax=Rhipicephalus sanguineus TaxID=34632 RepID=UPI0020C5A897|nr:uncharacterized protein LOC119385345 [Rhipicephalus sanguineus]
MASGVVKRAGFKNVNSAGFFKPSNEEKGLKLCRSRHVFDVTEEITVGQSILKARCVRQANVNQEAYAVIIELDATRLITRAHCNCRGGVEGHCKHAAAVVAFVNSEESVTKTSQPNKWKSPSNKQLKLYTKGVPFKEMFQPKTSPAVVASYIPQDVVKMNSSQGLMLRAFLDLKENAKRLEELLPKIACSSPCYYSLECKIEDVTDMEHIMIDEDMCSAIANRTVQQSLCPEWHKLRRERLSASSKAHRIRVRERDFEKLAHDLVHQKHFYNEACRYGTAMEATARKDYEGETGRTVTRIGLVVSKVQSWLCCSPDGLAQDDDVILIEIKCPFRCRDKPIHENATLAVDYLHVVNEELQLKENHAYYTQVQVSLYVLNLELCHFVVYSPLQLVVVKVRRNEEFLKFIIPKMEWFYFKFYKNEVTNNHS